MRSARSGFSRAFLIALALATSAVVACSGGGATTYVYITASPSSSPSASPTPTAPPSGVLSVNPTALSINGTGASYAQNVYVQETGYSGAFSESDNCTSIASVAPSSGAGPAATFIVTPSGAGTCTATFADVNGNRVLVAVTVTTTGFAVQTR